MDFEDGCQCSRCPYLALTILLIMITLGSFALKMFNKIDSGIISDKYIILENIDSVDGKFHETPQQYVFEITCGKKRYRFNVTKEEYTSYSIGDTYSR